MFFHEAIPLFPFGMLDLGLELFRDVFDCFAAADSGPCGPDAAPARRNRLLGLSGLRRYGGRSSLRPTGRSTRRSYRAHPAGPLLRAGSITRSRAGTANQQVSCGDRRRVGGDAEDFPARQRPAREAPDEPKSCPKRAEQQEACMSRPRLECSHRRGPVPPWTVSRNNHSPGSARVNQCQHYSRTR